MGVEMPSMATVMMAVSSQVPWATAARMPIVMPSVAASANAERVSWMVPGRTSRMLSSTGRWLRSATPRSPLTAWLA